MRVTPWLPRKAARRGPPLTARARVHVNHKIIIKLLTASRRHCRENVINSMGWLYELIPSPEIFLLRVLDHGCLPVASSRRKWCIKGSGQFSFLSFCHDNDWETSSLDYSWLAPRVPVVNHDKVFRYYFLLVLWEHKSNIDVCFAPVLRILPLSRWGDIFRYINNYIGDNRDIECKEIYIQPLIDCIDSICKILILKLKNQGKI